MRRKAAPPPLLRVATLNTWGLPFPLAWRSRTSRFPRIDAFLRGSAYDLVGLQEVWDGAHRLLPSHALHRPDRGGGDSGLAILSRLRAEAPEEHRFGRSTGPDAFKRKGVLARRVWAGERPAWFVVTHLQAGKSGKALDVRASQVGELIGLLGRLAGAAIVVGDFNFHDGRALDDESHAALVDAGLRDAAHEIDARAPTHAASGERFDRVYLRSGEGVELAPEYVQVLPAADSAALSDHAPVEVGVRVREAG